MWWCPAPASARAALPVPVTAPCRRGALTTTFTSSQGLMLMIPATRGRRGRRPLQMTDFFGRLAGAPFGTPALLSLYFLKLSFRDTLRLNTRCSAELSRLSRQK